MTIWHVAALLTAAALQGYALHVGRPDAVGNIVSVMVAGTLGNAMAPRGRGRATDVQSASDSR